VSSKASEGREGGVVARDVMTSPVISAPSTRTVAEAAQLMFDHGLGALPVLDASGVVVGMVSDGDLFGRRPEDDRREWWLSLISRGLKAVDLPELALHRPISEVMSAPVISISSSTTVAVIAEMLQFHRLKRLPVIDRGELVGIVSRTDLIARAAAPRDESALDHRSGGLMDFLESLIGGASLRGGVFKALEKHAGAEPAEPPPPPKAAGESGAFSAAALRARADAFKTDTGEQREAERLVARRERERKVKALIDQHVSREMWRTLLDHAEIAAAQGERELLMLRFPCELCSDGGRKIDVAEDGWEATLRGEAAEMFASWRDDLRPQGFRLAARIVSYEPGGVLGDVGLYLLWGG